MNRRNNWGMPSRLAMSSWKWFLLSFFGGGIIFWIPDLVIPALDRTEQGGAVTFACPALLVVFYMILRRLRKPERLNPSVAIFAICGMWVFALSFTLLAQWIRSEEGLGRFTGVISVISSFRALCPIEFLSLWRWRVASSHY